MEKKKILVVDDEVELCRLLHIGLTASGVFQVFTTHDGETGRMLAIRENPDLILLDIVMPGMSGGELAEELRENPLTASIPIIFMTAVISAKEEPKNGACPGGRMIIAKPLNLKSLLAQIQAVLAKGS